MSRFPKAALADVCVIQQGKTLLKKDMSESGFPVFGANGHIGWAESYHYDKPVVVIGCRGSCGATHSTLPKSFVTNNAMALLPKRTEELNVEFLRFVIAAADLSKIITGGVQPQITRANLQHHEIPLPPIEEQLWVVDILNRAASIERLRRQASAHLRDFIPALFLKMFGDPIENPMGWPTVQLREIVSEFRYGTSKKSYDEAVEGASPVLRIPNVIAGAVKLEDLKYTVLDAKEQSRLTLQRGDLLFVRTNGNPEYIGRCAVFDLSVDVAYASYLIRARVQETAPVSPFLIGDLMSLPSMRNVLLSLATTTAGNYNINIESLGSIVVPVPPRDAQDQYLSLARAAKSRMSLASDSGVLARNLSKSLLDRMLGADRS